jgi:hypothetical protein
LAVHQDTDDLPITWPFRIAGTLTIIALAYFCLGFAAEDTGHHLWQHLPVFQWLLLISLVLVIIGAVYNISRDRRRSRA